MLLSRPALRAGQNIFRVRPGVEERIVALMQMLNIIVVRPGDLRVGQCNGVDAEVGALIRDAFDVRQRIQKAESAVDRAFAV